ncbi:MAG: VWA domain-containing protein [Gemmataceae bacterium]
MPLPGLSRSNVRLGEQVTLVLPEHRESVGAAAWTRGEGGGQGRQVSLTGDTVGLVEVKADETTYRFAVNAVEPRRVGPARLRRGPVGRLAGRHHAQSGLSRRVMGAAAGAAGGGGGSPAGDGATPRAADVGTVGGMRIMTLLAPSGCCCWCRSGCRWWCGGRRRGCLLAVRAVSLLLTVLAAWRGGGARPAEPGRHGGGGGRSQPVDAAGQSAAQKEAVELVRAAMGGDDRLAVVSFGQEVAVEHAPGTAPFGGFTHQVGGNASNLAEAIETGLSLVPRARPAGCCC